MKRIFFTVFLIMAMASSGFCATAMTTLNTSDIIDNPTTEKVFDRADSNFTNLYTVLTTAESDVDLAEASITVLESDVDYAEASITAIESNIDTVESSITALEAVSVVLTYHTGSETDALAIDTGYIHFRAPFAFTLTEVRASVATMPTGNKLIFDLNEGGSSVLSTKLSIDNSETTSEDASTPYVISDSSIADDALMTFDIDQVGTTTPGNGVRFTIIGHL